MAKLRYRMSRRLRVSAVCTALALLCATAPQAARAELGDLVDGLTSRSPVLWSSGFEESDWKSHWHLSMDSFPGNRTIVSGLPRAHGKAMQLYSSARNDGFTGFGADMRSRFEDLDVANQTESVLRYSVYVPASWNPHAGGKLPGLAGVSPGTPVNETSGGGKYDERSWSGRVMWLKPADGDLDHARLTTYLYVRSAAGRSIYDNRVPSNGRIFGISVIFRDHPDHTKPWSRKNPVLTLDRGAWNTIALRYKMNTPGQRDGIFQGWLNGRLGVDLRDVQYRTATYPNADLNELMFSSFFGGPTANTTDQRWAFDDVAIAIP